MPDLAILYEHPRWFEPLFAALDRRGVAYCKLAAEGGFDPLDSTPPAPLVLNRVAMSAFLRDAEHPIWWAQSLLTHWERSGARVLNGAAALSFDTSKANQLSLIASLGLRVPRTVAVHRRADLPDAARRIGFPLLVKANIGGAGAGIARFEDIDALQGGDLPSSIDGVLLVQELIPARDGLVTRVETLDRAYLYAIQIGGACDFDLCPADSGAKMTAIDLAPALRVAAERIAKAAHLDLGGMEFMIDERDGQPKFYDVNALSNFVADPLNVLGWDPHDRLVDRLVQWIEEKG